MNFDYSELIYSIRSQYGLKESLLIKYSETEFFKKFEEDADLIIDHHGKTAKSNNVLFGYPEEIIENIKVNFDLVIGDLPSGMVDKSTFKSGSLKITERQDWIILLKSLFLLKSSGSGIFRVEPGMLGTLTGEKFVSRMNDLGFYIDSIFKTPNDILLPETSVSPLIIIITRIKKEKYFVAELNHESNLPIILKHRENNISISPEEGMFIKKEDFKGFESYKIASQLETLSNQYKDFDKYSMNEVVSEIFADSALTHKENSIYIQTNELSRVVTRIEDTQTTHSNLIQIRLKKDIVNAEYMALFMNTNMGKLNLAMIKAGLHIEPANSILWERLRVPLPGLNIQEKILSTYKSINQLEVKLSDFKEEIVFNPKNVDHVENDLNNILGSIEKINESDRVLALLRKGEGKTLEFKSTLRKSLIDKNIPDWKIELAVIKTIGAFMNSQGGTLLIGVEDNGNVIGLANDGFKSDDLIYKHLKNLIKRDIGPEFYDLINYKIIEVLNKKILKIEASRSDKPVFIGKNEEFYVRTNPATDKLSGKKQYEYIKNHFES